MSKEMQKYYEMEFNMLKDAHFQTSQKIISFFQYALLIFSAPLALLTSRKIDDHLLGLIFLVIGIIELIVIAYLTSLRAEALLYARQINRIRSIIYSEKGFCDNIENIHNKKILLSQDQKPDYKDYGQFVFIVLVLGCFSAFYSSFGFYKLLKHYFLKEDYVLLCSIGIAGLVLLLSIWIYLLICRRKENGTDYYKRRIGVDIDGVLNDHEKTFVEICNRINKTSLNVSDITSLPVHDSKIITLDQEQAVFRTKEYWKDQILAKNAKHILIDEIKNKYGYKPYIFTWRDWTIKKDLSGGDVYFNLKKQTKEWLNYNEIRYKKIVFEKGNIDRPVSAFQLKYRTRFYFSKKYKIRFFVEDNVYNAVHLAHICEYVFLINHEYNKDGQLPYNVIRVSNWDEILSWIKKLN